MAPATRAVDRRRAPRGHAGSARASATHRFDDLALDARSRRRPRRRIVRDGLRVAGRGQVRPARALRPSLPPAVASGRAEPREDLAFGHPGAHVPALRGVAVGGARRRDPCAGAATGVRARGAAGAALPGRSRAARSRAYRASLDIGASSRPGGAGRVLVDGRRRRSPAHLNTRAARRAAESARAAATRATHAGQGARRAVLRIASPRAGGARRA